MRAWEESNLRRTDSKSDALSTELQAHYKIVIFLHESCQDNKSKLSNRINKPAADMISAAGFAIIMAELE